MSAERPHASADRGPIYLDHNATTPPHADVIAAMAAAGVVAWANPSSTHRLGQRARAELDRARAEVARLTGFDARDVVLTSGGTEANNMALRSVFVERPRAGLVVSRIEHPSVTKTAEALAREGVAVAWVEPGQDGAVTASAVSAAMDALGEVALVALMAVNHETGVIQPVAEVAALAHARGALIHVDAVQAVGKLPASCWQGADSLVLAAHKIRGPKGVGALVTRPRAPKVRPILHGGAQERGLRPGTQSAELAAGFAVACELAGATTAAYGALAAVRDRLEAALVVLGERAHIEVSQNGTAARAPHVSNTSWPGWRSAELCAALDLEGVAASAGSACSAGTAEPSAVIRAMLGDERAACALRVSLGLDTSTGDIARALAAFSRVLDRKR